MASYEAGAEALKPSCVQRLMVIEGTLTKGLIQGADRQTVWMHMCNVWWPGSVCWQQPVSVKCAETIACAAFGVQAGLDFV